MKSLKFQITINASREKVWQILWDDATYRKWTSVFHEGSSATSDWKEGSKIIFGTPEGDGMYSLIEKLTPNETMVFKHIGEIKNGVEINRDWENARERYDLKDVDGSTELTVTLDTVGEFEEYFSNTFPKALDVVKSLSESN